MPVPRQEDIEDAAVTQPQTTPASGAARAGHTGTGAWDHIGQRHCWTENERDEGGTRFPVSRTTLEVTRGSCSVTTGNPRLFKDIVKGVRLNDLRRQLSYRAAPSQTQGGLAVWKNRWVTGWCHLGRITAMQRDCLHLSSASCHPCSIVTAIL